MWGISIPETIDDPFEKFSFLLTNTSDTMQVLQLCSLVYEWKLHSSPHSTQTWLALFKFLIAEERFAILFVLQFLLADCNNQEVQENLILGS